MKTLLLMRHAKSSWVDPDLADRDRPLAPRGRKAAPLVGKRLAKLDLVPDLVLCSDAARARETWEAMAAKLPEGVAVRHLRGLYPGAPSRINAAIARLPDAVGRVLVLGHAPGIATLARGLARDGERRPLDRLAEKFPTGAVAVIAFEASWDGLWASGGRLAAFIRPRDLA